MNSHRVVRPSFAAVRRCGLVAALCVLPMLASSCFTTALWSIGRAEKAEIRSRVEEADPDADQAWALKLFGRALLTPFAVVLDFVTSPYQLLVRDDDAVDDEPRTNYRMTSR